MIFKDPLPFLSGALLVLLLAACGEVRKDDPAATNTFAVRGVIRELKPDGHAVIAHEEITNYMAAMTMPFRLRDTNELRGLAPGDAIRFQLHVAAGESWIDGLVKTGRADPAAKSSGAPSADEPISPSTNAPTTLAEYLSGITFTNEQGRVVRWREFEGQAIGLTFFFTRCPLPEYCPRLSKNLAGASAKLTAMPNTPTNWHLLSVTFDPQFDTPAVLRSYAQFYGADSNRWSFLTAAPGDIATFARLFGLNYERDGGTINHDFRTVVIDAAGGVRAVWPIGGDTTDLLVTEMVKAAARNK
ncbi:MAG: SCO family protein [Verrucomicrobia bacterium]|nr:SCO family protein [Verrucomicrobiota bacterium]